MPIAISLDGEVLSMPEITEEQRDVLWSAIIRSYVRAHPDELRNLGEQKGGAADAGSD